MSKIGLIFRYVLMSCVISLCAFSCAHSEALDTWLDGKLVEWKPITYKPMIFTAVDWPLQSSRAKDGDSELDNLFLDVMLRLNTEAVYFSIFPQAYDVHKARYDFAVERIRQNKKTLIISYNVGGELDGDPTFVLPASTSPTISEYIAKEKQYIDYYAGYYHPEYFLVAVEPYTLNHRVDNDWSAADWEGIIRETSEYAKSIDPSIKVGAILTIADFEIFEKIKNMPSLDVIGFNVYENLRIYDEYVDPLYPGDAVGNRLDEIGAIGKEPWIFETWATSASSSTFNAPSRAEMDCKWIRAMTYYVQKHGAKNIMPFFSAKFISNLGSFSTTTLHIALEAGSTTQIFVEYANVMSEVRTALAEQDIPGTDPQSDPYGISSEHSGELKVGSTGGKGIVYAEKNEQAVIAFLPAFSGEVKIRIYTHDGFLVREELMEAPNPNTSNQFLWNCLNAEGGKVASGIYIVYVEGPGLKAGKKIAVMR